MDRESSHVVVSHPHTTAVTDTPIEPAPLDAQGPDVRWERGNTVVVESDGRGTVRHTTVAADTAAESTPARDATPDQGPLPIPPTDPSSDPVPVRNPLDSDPLSSRPSARPLVVGLTSGRRTHLDREGYRDTTHSVR